MVTFALLASPDLTRASVRTIAEASGVGLGTTTRALQSLREKRLVVGKSKSLELDPIGLWQTFERGYADRLATKLQVGRYRPLMPLQQWTKGVERHFGSDVLVGGGLGAERAGLDIVAATATLHIRDWQSTMIPKLRMLPDDSGPIVVRSQFGQHNGKAGQVNDLLLRAELLLEPDERLDGCRKALADRIRKALTDA